MLNSRFKPSARAFKILHREQRQTEIIVSFNKAWSKFEGDPEVTQSVIEASHGAKHFAKRGVQAECIKLNGAMELAPKLGLCRRIVDLVSSGRTLEENGLVEVEKILDVTSRVIVNRLAYKTRNEELTGWIDKFK